jgi:hypothetical protein
MTSGEEWLNEVKEEGDNESVLVDVESHDDLPNMKTEHEDSFLNQVPIKLVHLRFNKDFKNKLCSKFIQMRK